MAALEPPPRCMEIPGFILIIEPEKSWLTQNGQPTDIWEHRGVWPSEEAAEKALDTFKSMPNAKSNRLAGDET